jgi:hypothetical protein
MKSFVKVPTAHDLALQRDADLRRELADYLAKVKEPRWNVDHLFDIAKMAGKEPLNFGAYARFGVPIWENIPYKESPKQPDEAATTAFLIAVFLFTFILGLCIMGFFAALAIRVIIVSWTYLSTLRVLRIRPVHSWKGLLFKAVINGE